MDGYQSMKDQKGQSLAHKKLLSRVPTGRSERPGRARLDFPAASSSCVPRLYPFAPSHPHFVHFLLINPDNGNSSRPPDTKRTLPIIFTGMSSLQNMPYDLLLSIAQHLDLADIYALQLVRNNRLSPLIMHDFSLMPSPPRHAGTYAT